MIGRGLKPPITRLVELLKVSRAKEHYLPTLVCMADLARSSQERQAAAEAIFHGAELLRD
jgi:hypothetical protein